MVKEYTGNSNRDGIVINDLQEAVQGRAFLIIPVQWHGHISLRMELYGCHVDSSKSVVLRSVHDARDKELRGGL